MQSVTFVLQGDNLQTENGNIKGTYEMRQSVFNFYASLLGKAQIQVKLLILFIQELGVGKNFDIVKNVTFLCVCKESILFLKLASKG